MKNGIYEIFYRFYFDYLRIKRDILPRLRQRYLQKSYNSISRLYQIRSSFFEIVLCFSGLFLALKLLFFDLLLYVVIFYLSK